VECGSKIVNRGNGKCYISQILGGLSENQEKEKDWDRKKEGEWTKNYSVPGTVVGWDDKVVTSKRKKTSSGGRKKDTHQV